MPGCDNAVKFYRAFGALNTCWMLHHGYAARMKTILMTKLLLITTILATSACSFSVKPGHFADDRKAAELAVSRFHAAPEQEKYDDIYSQTANVLRRTGSMAELTSAMKKTHDKFGAFRGAEQVGANVIMGAARRSGLFTTRSTRTVMRRSNSFG